MKSRMIKPVDCGPLRSSRRVMQSSLITKKDAAMTKAVRRAEGHNQPIIRAMKAAT